MPSSPVKKHRDDSEARRAMRLSTWFALGTGALGVLLLALPGLLPAGGPWVQLGLGALTLFLAFRARAIGTRGVNDYDGRLSLLAAIAGFAILFFAGNAAFRMLFIVS
ncbi:hypothetical protein FVO59_04455 [Microbacterium esteraromaticum]|uniref:Uncharacterized protein n=1 Tax=Microbacterium esteraromaticum TaxID=57043 RepID=A0A7D8A9S0_9MICO|nr:hypothetical protein [Microbacterium esteraromaticum]QMU96541.1 hypothetical protein FVO59_04455 [Microbacterium esteraromaticum]